MSKNHPDNQQEVDKFWRGVFANVAVLVLAAVALPAAVGHGSDPPMLRLGWSGSIFMLLVAMLLRSNAISHLPKNE